MKRTILLATLFLVSGFAQAEPCAPAALPPIQPMQDEASRTDRIDHNTAARTDNRVERREAVAGAAGAPCLDQGIERRNDRREDRRDELRTGQPPVTAPAPPP